LPEEAFSSKGKYMKTIVGLWIDHRKAVIVAVSDKKEETKVIESNVEKQPGKFAGVHSRVFADDGRRRTPDV
jgi:hypothetical protein